MFKRLKSIVQNRYNDAHKLGKKGFRAFAFVFLTAPTWYSIITEICGGLVAGIESIGSGIATGAKSFVTALLFENGALSSFGQVAVIFGGVTLAIGLTTLIFRWIQNL